MDLAPAQLLAVHERSTDLVSDAPATPLVVIHEPRVAVVVDGFRGTPGVTGDTGPAGAGLQLDGSVTDYASLPQGLGANDQGQSWMTNNDGRVYVWSGTAWPAEGTAPVLQGPPGANGADGKPGQIRFTGHGAPGTIIGASPNDTYLDLDTGVIYQLT